MDMDNFRRKGLTNLDRVARQMKEARDAWEKERWQKEQDGVKWCDCQKRRYTGSGGFVDPWCMDPWHDSDPYDGTGCSE